jgi:UDP-galactose transporter B1
VLCGVVLILSLVTWQLPYTINFIIHHDELFLHIIVLGLTNAISAIFIYKVITLFRQHVYPLVSTVRKCITVAVSILYFGHHIEFAQLIGILLVFGGVMLEISMNYKLFQKWGVNLPF